jgi:hypothetical protein
LWWGGLRECVNRGVNAACCAQVESLKEELKPFLLRRLKADVETKIPPKEETVIDVELTAVQKQYYRAIYERNTDFLLRGAKNKNNAPNLMNVVMELRKVCSPLCVAVAAVRGCSLGCCLKWRCGCVRRSAPVLIGASMSLARRCATTRTL